MSQIQNGGIVVETILPVGVPSGGAEGQALVKKSGISFDLEWADVASGGGGTGNGDMLKSVYDPNDDGKIDYVNQVSNKPTLGTGSALDVAASGNASSSQLVKGNDSRLSDSRTPLSHSHLIADVTGLQAALDAKGSGTVTGASVASANGFTGSVANASTSPTLTLGTSVTGVLKGNGTALSAAVSGTDFKTINGNSILGAGDLTISAGGGSGTVTSFAFTNGGGFTGSVSNASSIPTLSLVLQNASTSQSGQLTSTDWNTFNNKQAALVSATNIKTVNGSSILGSGDLVISGGSGTVTSFSITSANGLGGSVTNATSTPALTLTTSVTGLVKGNGTGFSAAVAGTDYLAPAGSGAALTGITNSQVSGSAPLASPTFTGTPLSTTAAVDTNTTQIATTAFVIGQGYLKSALASSTYATIASLGTAAAATLTTSTTDATSGRVVKVGDYGVGAAPVSNDNWDTVAVSGKYRNTSTGATGIPEATAGLLMAHTYIDASTATQMGWNTSTGAVYTRNKASGTWGSWNTTSTGGVTTVSVASANGLGGSVANATTTPTLTLTTSVSGIVKANGTGFSAAVSGTDFKTINGNSILGSGDLVISGGGGGSGTVTSASVVSANGFTGSVANATTTPAITLTTSVTGIIKGNGTALSAATAGTDYLAPSGVTSSSTDTTAGKLLKVGDYGLGSAPITNNNWDTLTAGGRYINTSTGATGIPTALAGLICIHTYIDASTATQVAWDVLNNQMYTRRKNSSVWSGWSAGISAGTITRSVLTSSGSFTAAAALSTDYVYLIPANHTVTLPTAVGNTNLYTFKNNHSANITINTTSSQTIDGTTSISLAPQASVVVISTGSNWSVI